MGRRIPHGRIRNAPLGGDIRLLAPKARQASARGILALAAVAALALSGCGGGGSEEETTASAGSEVQSTATTDSTSSAKAKDGSQGSASAGEGKGQGATDANAQGTGKHAKQIQLPKGEPEPSATPAEEAKATVADIVLSSPSFGSASGSVAALPATYTCDGKGSWPALQWQGIPAGSEELIIFAMNVAPIEGKLFFDWALAGLPANLSGIEEGKLPKGAVQGQNSFGKVGYEICPPQGQAETYVFALYAIPKRLSPAKGFDPHRLREEALAAVGHAGILATTYSRG